MSEEKQYVTVYMRVSELRTDPVQYKPYSPVLTADPGLFPLYVAIDVEKKFIDPDASYEHDIENLPQGAVVVTLAGLTDMMGQIALAIRNRLEN